MRKDNIFSHMPDHGSPEVFTKLAATGKVRIERIVSRGHVSPEGFWYDQEQNEWVMVIAGSARIAFAGQAEDVELNAGDHIIIPAHVRHRVSWTVPDRETIWLAVHYDE